MKYSVDDIIGDNFDEEFETLCEEMGLPFDSEYEIYDTLPSGFTEHIGTNDEDKSTDFVMWVKSGPILKNSHSGEIAFEFGNAFLSIYYNEAM